MAAHIQLIRNSTNQKTFVDYSQVDLVSHSAGGLVARAYLQNTSIANDQTVHTLLTLATPHRGVPGAYAGWYGGDPTAILSMDQFQSILMGIAWCKNGMDEVDKVRDYTQEDYFYYFRFQASSIENFIPRADHISPAYLVNGAGTAYPYPSPPGSQKPPSLFLDDLNTDGGLYDITKLGNISRVISSYASNYSTILQYEVGPPPPSPPHPDYWKYGVATRPITQAMGDQIVPAYSSDLTEITALSPFTNIVAYREGANFDLNDPLSWPPKHVEFVYKSTIVRRIISYVTGIDITNEEKFWDAEYDLPSTIELLWTAYSCSPVRLLITDPLGRHAGLDLNTGQVINEIPGALVTENGMDPQLIMLPDIEGEYQVQGIGVSEGAYKIGAIYGITKPIIVRTLTGTTTLGQIHNFAFQSPPLSPPIYLPLILKNSTSTPVLLTPPEDNMAPVFSSPLSTPKQEQK